MKEFNSVCLRVNAWSCIADAPPVHRDAHLYLDQAICQDERGCDRGTWSSINSVAIQHVSYRSINKVLMVSHAQAVFFVTAFQHVVADRAMEVSLAASLQAKAKNPVYVVKVCELACHR